MKTSLKPTFQPDLPKKLIYYLSFIIYCNLTEEKSYQCSEFPFQRSHKRIYYKNYKIKGIIFFLCSIKSEIVELDMIYCEEMQGGELTFKGL